MTQDERTQRESRWPHRWAVMLCCATFPLIWVGGLVTTYDAGMAVPDWPSTYGYNLLLYPWTTWLFGPWDLMIEHGHRLLGIVVGMLTISLLVSVWLQDSRRWLRLLAVVALLLVIAQGGLGGARVLLDARLLAMLHGCLGPGFFAVCVALAVCTSRLWREPPAVRLPHARAGRLHRLALLTGGFAYVQLVLGAQLRHVPVMATQGWFRAALLFHVLIAIALVVHVALLAVDTLRPDARQARLVRPLVALIGLLALQMALGAATWIAKYGWPHWFVDYQFAATYTVQAKSMSQAMIVTSHVAVGSLILAVAVLLALRSLRLVRTETAALGSTAMLMGWSS